LQVGLFPFKPRGVHTARKLKEWSRELIPNIEMKDMPSSTPNKRSGLTGHLPLNDLMSKKQASI
jgi:hypothetical protein